MHKQERGTACAVSDGMFGDDVSRSPRRERTHVTGGCPENSSSGHVGEHAGKVRRASSGSSGSNRLLYVRTRASPWLGEEFKAAGGALTLLGVGAGLVLGYGLFRLGIVVPTAPVRYFMVWLTAVPALVGGAIGALIAWARMRTRLAQALVTSEGFRQRLMSVERNQALWVSLSAVLHDVRNPLHNMNLLVESLAAPGADTERVRREIIEQLDRIRVRLRRVTSQIAELSGEIERLPVDIDGVLAQVVDMINPLVQQTRATLEISAAEDARVIGDPKFLVQAIDHLILNSLQILSEQPAGQPRTLVISHHHRESAVEMWIEDSGPGLPEEVRRRLFEPLTASRTNGMGLGLAIAHALATAAGAELTLGRTGPHGTRFILHMPRCE